MKLALETEISDFSAVWTRMSCDDIPIYVRQDTPDWVVPNNAGDRLLQRLGNKDVSSASYGMKDKQFLSLFSSPPVEAYQGRLSSLTLETLEECWLHITDSCNLACRHCLFSCSPQKLTTLSYSAVAHAVKDAYALGARTFYLTGGEPLVHPEFQEICRLILIDHPDTNLVILTNGVLIPEHLAILKSLPSHRLFLQISVDGIAEVNDNIRGKGTYQKQLEAFSALSGLDIRTTLAMAVQADNYHQMADIVTLAGEHNFSGVHYMWLLIGDKISPQAFVPPDLLFKQLVQSHQVADQHHLVIDNISNLSSQVFSPPGTKYDLSNAGWSSLALGPDGNVYPTPALVGRADVGCGSIKDDRLEFIWRSSSVLNDLRSLSILQDERYSANPLKYIVGGGDIDHSYFSGGAFIGDDPYVPLYNRLALWLMAESAGVTPALPWPQIRRKMGEKLQHCVSNGAGVALTHSNCVLTFSNARTVVGDFYTAADEADNEHIINPVCSPEADLTHIPVSARIRSYGCGSPVLDAELMPGEVVVDLGAGAGVECYIAARKVGPKGQVIGIDMLDHMLSKANRYLDAVAQNLGYRNVTFKKGYLEDIPLEDSSVETIISNCVINLSEDKRQTFAEIFRVLKPGGRICISDVVTDTPSPPAIQNDAELRGECIAGAMVQSHLMAIMESAGFHHIRIIKRFFYREVQGHAFYSITYKAYKPPQEECKRVIYPGPYAGVIMDTGEVLLRGETSRVNWPYPAVEDGSVFILDEEGNISNLEGENPCACSVPSAAVTGCDCSPSPDRTEDCGGDETETVSSKSMTGCMACGKPLRYLNKDRPQKCVFCGKTCRANALCDSGHFVCDNCHISDMIEATKTICTHTDAVDMIDLLTLLRSHPSFPLHGPEHHFAVPGVILACYKNSGGDVSEQDIITAIERGQAIPSGTCGFWGTCGAAIAVGIAFGVILKSNPLAPKTRQCVQEVAGEVIKELNQYEAARCCRREAFTALTVAAALSGTYLPVKLKTEGNRQCRQQGKNKECIQQACPYFKAD